jgi:flagellar motility protein MotE (MotC chaperone)
MDHDYLEKLKQAHPTLRLIAADNVPLIISFLFLVFIRPNQRSLPQAEITSRLDDYLFHLREIHGEEKYPRSARQYLEDWAGGKTPFLRKYYTDSGDEPEFDLTPATERAVEWLQSLAERRFVGTESRLLTVFNLLKELVRKTSLDPAARIAELERRKEEIDAEIERLRVGIVETYDPTQVKERFLQAEETARRLLADFRQVEYNFRALDREIRERIALSDRPKGKLLDEIFHEQDAIRDSDQGKSFHAFWEFLMSALRQEELAELLEAVYGLEEVRSLNPSPFLSGIKFSLMDAGEKVYKTTGMLVEQLRRFLDEQGYLENRRIMELVKGIEKKAVAIKDAPPTERDFAFLDDVRPDLELVMARGLFAPTTSAAIGDSSVTVGEADIQVDALYRRNFVNEAELRGNIRKALQTRPQITLSRLVEFFPVRKGLAEVVTYLELAHREGALVTEDVEEELTFSNEAGEVRRVSLPRVIFVR